MTPSILLVGCGKFGKNHLRILKKLHKKNVIILKGVVTKTQESAARIAKKEDVKTFTEIKQELLDEINAVFIVSPPETHIGLAKRILPNVDLFVEKPLALKSEHIIEINNTALKFNRKLMVGHIYRFSEAVKKIKSFIGDEKPELIKINLTGGIQPENCGAMHEFLHAFDIIDFLLEQMPQTVTVIEYELNEKGFDTYVKLNLSYSKTKVIIEVGWATEKKHRDLFIRLKDNKIKCELSKHILKIDNEVQTCNNNPLKAEIERFIEVIQGKELYYPNATVALRIQKVINSALLSIKSK